MRQLRLHLHEPWYLPALRKANLIWLRRILAGILIIMAIILIVMALVTSLAIAVGLELHWAGMP